MSVDPASWNKDFQSAVNCVWEVFSSELSKTTFPRIFSPLHPPNSIPILFFKTNQPGTQTFVTSPQLALECKIKRLFFKNKINRLKKKQASRRRNKKKQILKKKTKHGHTKQQPTNTKHIIWKQNMKAKDQYDKNTQNKAIWEKYHWIIFYWSSTARDRTYT